ncbi:hypothetical protein [Amycolatopsis sp. NPDC059021]|uniref:hypothetical protein n=1 Tax=Amycolatopsis sp. NPDC059021 TaxID=3346704 RepID=UPI00366FEF1F
MIAAVVTVVVVGFDTFGAAGTAAAAVDRASVSKKDISPFSAVAGPDHGTQATKPTHGLRGARRF